MALVRIAAFLVLLIATATPSFAASIDAVGISQVGCAGPNIGNLISFASGAPVDPAGHATYTGMTALGLNGPSACTALPLFLGLGNGQSTTITFDGLIDFFGLAWETVNFGDRVQLYRGSLLVDSFVGGDLSAFANISQGNRSLYVTFSDPEGFDRVVLLEDIQGCCFQSLGHRYRLMTPPSPDSPTEPVPEPSTVLLFAVGVSAATFVKRGTPS